MGRIPGMAVALYVDVQHGARAGVIQAKQRKQLCRKARFREAPPGGCIKIGTWRRACAGCEKQAWQEVEKSTCRMLCNARSHEAPRQGASSGKDSPTVPA